MFFVSGHTAHVPQSEEGCAEVKPNSALKSFLFKCPSFSVVFRPFVLGRSEKHSYNLCSASWEAVFCYFLPGKTKGKRQMIPFSLTFLSRSYNLKMTIFLTFASRVPFTARSSWRQSSLWEPPALFWKTAGGTRFSCICSLSCLFSFSLIRTSPNRVLASQWLTKAGLNHTQQNLGV